ncbi:hypothetical protein CsSME_00046921 [Camellia sinensis var. sinensis]
MCLFHTHLQIGLWPAATGNRKCRGEVEKIVEAVVALTLRGMLLLPWDTLEELPNTVRDSVFGTIAKFVLSIFDVFLLDSIVFHHLLDKDTRMITEPLYKGLIRVLS